MSILEESRWKPNHWGDSWNDGEGALEAVVIGRAGALICDPTYLCDLNVNDDESSKYIRENSVMFWDDHGGMVWYKDPLIVIGEVDLYGFELLADQIGGDSGSMVLMSLDSMPLELKNTMAEVLEANDGRNGLILKPVPGKYYPYTAWEHAPDPEINAGGDVSILKRIG